MMKAVITVTGKDATGIIAGVATRLAELKANILEITQNVLSGYFTMLMIVDISACSGDFGALQEQMQDVGQQLGMDVSMQRMDLFDAMHRV